MSLVTARKTFFDLSFLIAIPDCGSKDISRACHETKGNKDYFHEILFIAFFHVAVNKVKGCENKDKFQYREQNEIPVQNKIRNKVLFAAVLRNCYQHSSNTIDCLAYHCKIIEIIPLERLYEF